MDRNVPCSKGPRETHAVLRQQPRLRHLNSTGSCRQWPSGPEQVEWPRLQLHSDINSGVASCRGVDSNDDTLYHSLMSYTPHLTSLVRRARLRQLKDLTLAHVLAGDTCTPISIAEFEAYLAFQENALQYLQFVVWFQDYTKRFFALPAYVRHLAPGPPDEVFERARNLRPLFVHVRADTISDEEGALCPQDAPSSAEAKDRIIRELLPDPGSVTNDGTLRDSWGSARALVQPFREECLHIAQTFFKPGSPKELRIDPEICTTVFTRLRRTTHPDVFLAAYERIYNHLETVSLPNFVVIETTNINVTKQVMWYCLAFSHVAVALSIMIVGIFAISDVPRSKRAWRTFAVPVMFVGLTQLYMALNGICRKIWKRGGTQLRVWELQTFEDAKASAPTKPAAPAQLRGNDHAAADDVAPSRAVVLTPPSAIAQPRVDKVLPGTPEEAVFVSLNKWAHEPSSPSDSGNDGDSEAQFAEGLKAPYSPQLSQYSPQPLLPRSPSYDSEMGARKLARNRRSYVPNATGQLRNGLRRPPVFGPEKVVQDKRIRAVHQQILRGMLLFSLSGTLIFCIPLFAIPGIRK